MSEIKARKNILGLFVLLAIMIPAIWVLTLWFSSNEYRRDFDLLFKQELEEAAIQNMIYEPNGYFNKDVRRVQLKNNVYWLATSLDESEDIYIGDKIYKRANTSEIEIETENKVLQATLIDVVPELKSRSIRILLYFFSFGFVLGYLVSRFAPEQMLRYWQ